MIYSGFEKKRYDDWLISDLIVKNPKISNFGKILNFRKIAKMDFLNPSTQKFLKRDFL